MMMMMMLMVGCWEWGLPDEEGWINNLQICISLAVVSAGAMALFWDTAPAAALVVRLPLGEEMLRIEKNRYFFLHFHLDLKFVFLSLNILHFFKEILPNAFHCAVTFVSCFVCFHFISSEFLLLFWKMIKSYVKMFIFIFFSISINIWFSYFLSIFRWVTKTNDIPAAGWE